MAAFLLRMRVRISPGARMFSSCECCVDKYCGDKGRRQYGARALHDGYVRLHERTHLRAHAHVRARSHKGIC